MAEEEIRVRCDCCGKEVLAVIRDGKLIITDRRHGQRHIAIVQAYQLANFPEKLQEGIDKP